MGVLEARIARARSAIGKGIAYKLGHGGYHPEDDGPTRDGSCDCSGFAAWLLPMCRDLHATGKDHAGLAWIETTAVHRDAKGPQRLFTKLSHPVPGCFAVYPDGGGHEGHIGLVTGVEPFTVIDCSLGSYSHYGDAIREHTGAVFAANPHTIYVALKGESA